jgi:hypothetical protein
MENFLIFLCDTWDKVQAEHSILRLKDKRAKSKKILNRSMLTFVDILQHPQIDRLVVVVRDEGALYAMDAPVCHNDDVQKMAVENSEKTEVDTDPCCGEKEQNGMAR